MAKTENLTSQANALATVIASIAKTRETIRFSQTDDSTYVYGSNPGSLERIARVSDDGEVEWIA